MIKKPEIGDRVKKLRLQKQLTMKQLGEACGVTFQNIGNLEAGIVTGTPRYIKPLAKALDVTVDYLLGHEEKYQSSEQTHNLCATDRPVHNNDIDLYVVSVPRGEKPSAKNSSTVAKIIRVFE